MLHNRFLGACGNFFVLKYSDLKDLYVGRRGAVMYAPSENGMNQPKPLANGWYTETCLNEKQKDRNLYLLAQRIGISSETDYQWHAENGPVKAHRDVSTLKRLLRKLEPPSSDRANPSGHA